LTTRPTTLSVQQPDLARSGVVAAALPPSLAAVPGSGMVKGGGNVPVPLLVRGSGGLHPLSSTAGDGDDKHVSKDSAVGQ
jgi:hypothetical protein